jgi:hypothetical protein
MARLLVTVWPEAGGWRVDDGSVSEFYRARSSAVARAEMLADLHSAAGRELGMVFMGADLRAARSPSA